MEENQFWVSIWKVIGTVFIMLVLTIAGCNGYETHKVAEAVKDSPNPIQTACALGRNPGADVGSAGILCLKAVEK